MLAIIGIVHACGLNKCRRSVFRCASLREASVRFDFVVSVEHFVGLETSVSRAKRRYNRSDINSDVELLWC